MSCEITGDAQAAEAEDLRELLQRFAETVASRVPGEGNVPPDCIA